MSRFIVLVFMIFSAGCVTHEPKSKLVYHSDDKTPVVYIYRPSSFSNVIISPAVIIDGKERFLIKSGDYTFVYLSPGRHAFKLKLDKNIKGVFEEEIDLKSGEVRFLRVDTSMKFVQGQPYIRTFNLNWVNEERGMSDIKKCKHMSPDMPSKNFRKKNQSGEESRFTTDKTSDPFSRNK